MHSKGIAHCDIKSLNVLLEAKRNGQLECILTDFGISQIFDRTRIKVMAFNKRALDGASLRYAPPEDFLTMRNKMNDNLQLKRFSDIYS